jgi:hypothetical protein
MTESMGVLLAGLIDYAGLFPPAKLDMSRAASGYARHLMGPNARALGRFICPVSRLDALSRDGAVAMPGTYATSGYQEMLDVAEAWSVSALLDTPLPAALDAIDAFNERHQHPQHGRARIDAVEMKVAAPGEVDDALDEIPEDLSVAFEFPRDAVIGGDVRGYVAALSGTGAAAKLRTGGVTPDLFPSVPDVARFFAACDRADVAFKATAGLHHPVRADHALTYEPGSPRAVMHGFLNVFVGAALLRARAVDQAALERVLGETDAAAFAFNDQGVSWRDRSIDLTQLARAREGFCLSYGSCSFDEPFDDLRALRLV